MEIQTVVNIILSGVVAYLAYLVSSLTKARNEDNDVANDNFLKVKEVLLNLNSRAAHLEQEVFGEEK